MDYKRLALAAVVAWFVDTIYGIIVWMMMLGGEFAKYPQVFRPQEAMTAKLPLMFAGGLLAMFALAYIYAKGYEGGSGVAEGARFGLLIAVFVVCVFAGINYATLNMGRRMAVVLAAAGFVEWLVAGIVIGLVYKGKPRAV